MTHIEVNNRMVANHIQDKLDALAEGDRPNKFISEFADFDGSRFNLRCEDRENVSVSLTLRYWETLENDANVVSYLDNIYSNTLAKRIDTLADSNITFNINIKELFDSGKEMQEKTIHEISRLKRNCFAAAFNVHFEAHKSRSNVTKTVIPFRPEETMFIKAKSDHVVVIFSTTFKDPDDQILAKIFLQEFQDARLGPGSNPPNVLLGKEPPAEIANEPTALTGDHVYYLTFVLQNAHIEPQAKADNTIDLIHNFRTYLHYHIKCSKAYIHQRMRAKTDEFRQILNRAKPETGGVRTIS